MYIVKISHPNYPECYPIAYIGPFGSEAEAERYAEKASRKAPRACVKAIRLVSEYEFAF